MKGCQHGSQCSGSVRQNEEDVKIQSEKEAGVRERRTFGDKLRNVGSIWEAMQT